MAILGTEKTSILSKGGVTENNISILKGSDLHDLASVDGIGLAQVNPAITELQPANPTLLASEITQKYLDNLPK